MMFTPRQTRVELEKCSCSSALDTIWRAPLYACSCPPARRKIFTEIRSAIQESDIPGIFSDGLNGIMRPTVYKASNFKPVMSWITGERKSHASCTNRLHLGK